MTGGKFWVRTFLDPGRLTVEADGSFKSVDTVLPGNYHLRLFIGQKEFRRAVTIPNPVENPIEAHLLDTEHGESPILDLGEISVAETQTSRPF
jgi:hypothetical protein